MAQLRNHRPPKALPQSEIIAVTEVVTAPVPVIQISPPVELVESPIMITEVMVPAELMPSIPSIIDECWSNLVVNEIPSTIQLNQGTTVGSILKAGEWIGREDVATTSGKTYDPTIGNKIVRVFDGHWQADQDYLIVNYCVFPTHLELELKKQ